MWKVKQRGDDGIIALPPRHIMDEEIRYAQIRPAVSSEWKYFNTKKECLDYMRKHWCDVSTFQRCDRGEINRI